MSTLLQKLLGRVYMAPHSDDESGSSGGPDDLDLDLDEDDDGEEKSFSFKPDPKPEVKVGDQDDGSVIVELEDDDGEKKTTTDGDAETEADGSEEQSDAEKELEARREARRQERHERKQRAKEKEESTKRELAAERQARQQLEARLAALEGRDRSREIAEVDNDIRAVVMGYKQAEAAYAEAIENQDGEAATKAMAAMHSARDRFARLETTKKAYEQQQKAPAAPSNPVTVNHAQKFMQDHQWYKHGTNDVDSNIVVVLDNALSAEGWDPATKEYWDELRVRIKKHLPHRVASGKVSTTAAEQAPGNKKPAPARQQQKAVVGGGGGESNGAGKGTFHLSPERVKALKDAGIWDDPKARNDMIRSYRDFDKLNKKGN